MPPHITSILSAEDLARLRSGYRFEEIVEEIDRGLAQVYPPLAEWVRAGAAFFEANSRGAGRLSPGAREAAILALFASKKDSGAFSIHVYWALAMDVEPLEPAALADIVSIAAIYSGVHTIAFGFPLLVSVQEELLAAVRSDEVTTKEVLARLRRRFGRH